MTTLMIMKKWGIPDYRRCDAKCHNAKGGECNCICGGELHGVGENVAMEILRKRYGFTSDDPAGAIVCLPIQREIEFLEVNIS